MCMRFLESLDNRIVIVGINEEDIIVVGQLIFFDVVYVKLLEKLKVMELKVIGLDVYWDLFVEFGYQELVEIFKFIFNIVGIEKVVGEKEMDVIKVVFVLVENNQVGVNDLKVDLDEKI